jgi:hypothetical protein
MRQTDLQAVIGDPDNHYLLQNIEALQQAGAMALLRPLLLDNVARYALGTADADNLMLSWKQLETSQLCPLSLCLVLTSLHAVHVTGAILLNSIQQSAALALGRLANYSDDLAEAVVQNDILPQLVSKCASLQQLL